MSLAACSCGKGHLPPYNQDDPLNLTLACEACEKDVRKTPPGCLAVLLVTCAAVLGVIVLAVVLITRLRRLRKPLDRRCVLSTRVE